MDAQTSLDNTCTATGRPNTGSVAFWIAVLAMACAIATVVGSLDFRTTRTWDLGSGFGQGHQEGAARWAALTFLAGILALGLLAASARALRRAVKPGVNDGRMTARICAALAVSCLGLAASVSTQNWLRVLDEQQRATEYTLVIARGLPIVTGASIIGTGLALAMFSLTVAPASARRPGSRA